LLSFLKPATLGIASATGAIGEVKMQLDDAADVGEQVDDLITQNVIACLQPLPDDSQADQWIRQICHQQRW
jgi:hypothetical protein